MSEPAVSAVDTPAVPQNIVLDNSDDETEEGPKITQVDHINAKLLTIFKVRINENEERFTEVAGPQVDSDDDPEWTD